MPPLSGLIYRKLSVLDPQVTSDLIVLSVRQRPSKEWFLFLVLISFCSRCRRRHRCCFVCWNVFVRWASEAKHTSVPDSSFVILVLTIFNEGAYLTFKSIFNKALNLF